MSRRIGNDIFKTIVEMAYEMEVAEKMEKRVYDGLGRAISSLESQSHTYRDTATILKEVNRFHKLSYKNKKYFVRDTDFTDYPRRYVSAQPIYVTLDEEIDMSLMMEKWLDDADTQGNINIILPYSIGDWSYTTRDVPFSAEQIERQLDGKRESYISYICSVLYRTFYRLTHLMDKTRNGRIWRERMEKKKEAFKALRTAGVLNQHILTAREIRGRSPVEIRSREFWRLMRSKYPRQIEYVLGRLDGF